MKVAALVSGGVDSSVALAMLKSQGYDVDAFYIKIWLEEQYSELGECPWKEDLKYARAVCSQLAVPLQIISLQKEYWDEVVKNTVEEVERGRTPNPDMLCNQRIKFGKFYDAIQGYDRIATGHYAQTEKQDGMTLLKRNPDPIKDQTYFLAMLSQEQASKAMFPIGELTKKEVRELAARFELPNKDRKDSQGICFLGKIKFKEFIKAHLGEKPGDIIEQETGRRLGEHPGAYFYTIGQREGLGLHAGPWYVVKKNIEDNKVYVSQTKPSCEEGVDEFFVENTNWIANEPEKGELQVKVRHGPQMYDCTIREEKGRLKVRINGKDEGIAPGQYAVFYDGDVCLGGGVITLT